MARRDAAGLVSILCLIAATTACIRIGGTQQRRLVNLNDGPMALRLRVAQEYANQQQLGLLRASAKAQFPNLTDQDLATLNLAWQHAVLADGEHVMLEVTFMPESTGVDASAVADYVASRILDDVRPKFQSSTPSG
jgi:hypothetical protein